MKRHRASSSIIPNPGRPVSLYAFYQEVRIVRPSPENTAYTGRLAVIVGLGNEPGQPVLYGLLLDGEEQLVSCEESELAPTGRQFRREDFYDDAHPLRVRVDDEGRGHLA